MGSRPGGFGKGVGIVFGVEEWRLLGVACWGRGSPGSTVNRLGCNPGHPRPASPCELTEPRRQEAVWPSCRGVPAFTAAESTQTYFKYASHRKNRFTAPSPSLPHPHPEPRRHVRGRQSTGRCVSRPGATASGSLPLPPRTNAVALTLRHTSKCARCHPPNLPRSPSVLSCGPSIMLRPPSFSPSPPFLTRVMPPSSFQRRTRERRLSSTRS